MAKETRKPDVEKLLPQDSQRGPLSGRLSDLLMMPESLRRTGRAAALSEAAGEKTPASLKYPQTTTLGGTAIGAGAGGVLGGLGGLLTGLMLEKPFNGPAKPYPDFKRIGGLIRALGMGVLGAGTGSLGVGGYTYLNSVRKRRKLIEAVKEKVKEKELNTDNVTLGNPLASPFSGMHQLGKSDVLTGNVDDKNLQNVDNVARVMTMMPNPIGIAGLGMGIGTNVAAYQQARKAHKTAGFRGPLDIIPPKSLGNKGIQHVLKDLMRRKKLTKQPFPYPSEVLDRVAGRIADSGFLRKKSELNKEALIGPSMEIGNLGIPSAMGYLLGRSNEKNKTLTMSHISKDDDEFRSNLIKRIHEDSPSAIGRIAKFLLVPGYTGYRLGKGSGRAQALKMLVKEKAKQQEKQARCWEGFEPVPGKKAYSEGSCRPKTQTTKRVNEKRSEDLDLRELVGAIDRIKQAEGAVTIYYASPNRQLTRIPKDAVVSMDQDLAFQMGRYYPDTKETWNIEDVSGKWTGGTPSPTFKAGRMPMGRPMLYRAEVMQSDLGTISDMVKSVKKLRRSVNAVAVKQKEDK